MRKNSNERLGFDHMKAAVVGGHDLSLAWLEIVEIAVNEKRPTAIVGATVCMLFCTECVERAGMLPDFPVEVWNDFLHSGWAQRLATCTDAARALDFGKLGILNTVMATGVEPQRDRIVFMDDLPTLV